MIGKVGTLLGKHEINIGAYLLSNDEHQNEAFAAIRLDSQAPVSYTHLTLPTNREV